MSGPDAAAEHVGLLEGLATTRAIRRYRPDPIPDDDLARILWAGTRAPTGSNRQPVRFVVLRADGSPDSPAERARRLLGAAFRAGWAAKRHEVDLDAPADSARARAARAMTTYVDHFEATPVVLLVCLERYRAPNPYEGASVYPACQNVLLAARGLGYGGVLTMWHLGVETELRDILGVPEHVALSACLTLGRPQGRHGPVRRRPLADVVHDGAWGNRAAWATEPS